MLLQLEVCVKCDNEIMNCLWRHLKNNHETTRMPMPIIFNHVSQLGKYTEGTLEKHGFAEEDTSSALLGVEQTAIHRCLIFGLDAAIGGGGLVRYSWRS
jgi:hypothetical protein